MHGFPDRFRASHRGASLKEEGSRLSRFMGLIAVSEGTPSPSWCDSDLSEEESAAAIKADVEAWWHLRAGEAAQMLVERAIAGQKSSGVSGRAFCRVRCPSPSGGQETLLRPLL